MPQPRILMIGLDGYEPTIGDSLMADGQLPALARLKAESACFALDHGAARRTGLAWEHVASGLSPDDARRWAAVDFDPATYSVRQVPTTLTPFPARLAARTVVFDPPYFDLNAAPNVRGAVAWGAHDPGVPQACRPAGLWAEIEQRYGRYPAPEWIYGFVWPSPAKAQAMANGLWRAAAMRSDIATWLLTQRLPDWNLGLVVAGEFHSAIEALWHGIDPAHPLHHLPSAPAAREGIEAVYRESDRLVATLRRACPDARLVAFNLHGMGANNSDAPSMALLAELLYRHRFGKPLLQELPCPVRTPDGLPLLAQTQTWSAAMASGYGDTPSATSRRGGIARRLSRLFGGGRAAPSSTLDWMPATRYRPYWSRMTAFALPSFYDGRVRVNLAGREAGGTVAPGRYDAVLGEIESLLRECRDTRDGSCVVASLERCAAGRDPLTLGPSEADLVAVWSARAPMGFDHPTLGRIGPLPYRRTGGHTGGAGMAWFCGEGIVPGDLGTTSAFDVVPTVLDLLGEWQPGRFSGNSVAGRFVRSRDMAPA